MGKSVYFPSEEGGHCSIAESPGKAALVLAVTGVTQWKGLKAKGADLESCGDPTEISTFGV